MATKKITLKKSRRWYSHDPAIISSIQFCVDWGLSPKKALAYLFEKHGCDMDERTYRRIKNKLSNSNSQKLQIITDESISFIHESVGDLRKSRDQLVNIIEDSENSSTIKIHASIALVKNLESMAKFYDSSQIISQFSALKEESQNALQKLAKVS